MSKNPKNYTNTPKVVNVDKVMTASYDMFTLVTKQGKTMIAVADKIVSREMFENEEQAQRYIDSKPWELLVNVACVCYDLMNKQTNKK